MRTLMEILSHSRNTATVYVQFSLSYISDILIMITLRDK